MCTEVPDCDRHIARYLSGRSLIAFSIINKTMVQRLDDAFWIFRLQQRWGKIVFKGDPRQLYNTLHPMNAEEVGLYAIASNEIDLLRAMLRFIVQRRKPYMPQVVESPEIDVEKRFRSIRLIIKQQKESTLPLYMEAALLLENLEALSLMMKITGLDRHLETHHRGIVWTGLLSLNRGTEHQYKIFRVLLPLWNKENDLERLLHCLGFWTHESFDMRIVDDLVGDSSNTGVTVSVLGDLLRYEKMTLFHRLLRCSSLPKIEMLSRLLIFTVQENAPPGQLELLCEMGATGTYLSLNDVYKRPLTDIKHLRSLGMPIERQENRIIIHYAKTNNLEGFTYLISQGVDITAAMSSLMTIVCKEGREEWLRLLIRYGGQKIHDMNSSALRIATYNNHISLIKLLLEAGSDPNAALPNAVSHGSRETIELIQTAISERQRSSSV